MTRITAGLLAAAAVGGWLTPLAAQKASRGPSLRAASYIYLTPNPYLGSLTALASAFLVTLLIDAAQTRELAREGWQGFRESNPLLGERPSVGRVNSYTALAGLTVLGVAAAAPPRLRPWLLGAAVAVQLFTIQGSVRQGIPIRFP